MAGRNKQTLRIIGGQWRGRKFQFPDVEHLRPTPDRVRETLFNWLMPVIRGAQCLDLFCGSGALGIEALSRGAAQVTFVDKNRQAINSLTQTCQVIGCDHADFYSGDANAYLTTCVSPVDIAFIDPPYDLQLQAETANRLQESGCLTEYAWIYLEHDGRFDELQLPASWVKHREKTAGQIVYALYRNH